MINIISQYLRNSGEKYFDRTAFVNKDQRISYREFLENAENIAWVLCCENLFKKPIALMMDKSIEALTCFFGISISGNYYTIIDIKMPETRIQKILETFSPDVLIVDNKGEKKLVQFEQRPICDVYKYSDILEGSISEEKRKELLKVEKKIIDTDILYVLFTSGSTGTPKGVIISHRSVIDYIEWAAETFHFDENTVFGNQAPFYFDNSVLDIYSTIRCGGTMHIIPQMLFSFPIRLLEYIRDNNINTVFWVPTVLSRIADLNILDDCDIDCLNKVLFAGEVMPARQLNIWRRRLPKAIFANLYGPTEITVDCTYYIVDRDIKDDESVPIGHPCRNSDIIILNQDNKSVGANEKGELCVRGSSLSLGYYNDLEKTKSVFVQNPLNSIYQELIYRTGDIVHYNENGEIIYDGRKDFQVKHTGHRIELGEIETVVSSLKEINMNCCIHKISTDQLILFYTGDIDSELLRKRLAKLLPEYMIPNVYEHLKDMPINLNGKIDRVALKDKMNNS